MGAAWGLPAGAGHYSGGGRTVNTRFAAGVPVPPGGGSVGIKEGYGRPGIHVLWELAVPALCLDLLDLDAAKFQDVLALGEGLVLDAE
jgi:hypothetical protein